MILDSQALTHLEIVEATGAKAGDDTGSLFKFINYTRTPFGKRALKRWLMSPLMNIKLINERLDAIDDLKNN